MKQYKAFISYRKSSAAVYANLVKQSLVDSEGFHTNEIFLARHNIGPKEFDKKIKTSIVNSTALILVVSNDCFIHKKNEDWFIQEIKWALSNSITIIPILFDDIQDLSQPEIIAVLEKSFSAEEIDRLVKYQVVKYNSDYSEPSMKLLSSYIDEAHTSWLKEHRKEKFHEKFRKAIFGVLAIFVCFALFFGLCFSIGYGWGYLRYSDSDQSIVKSNTVVEGFTAKFNFRGLNASYNVRTDQITIDISDDRPVVEDIPISLRESMLSSFSVSGAFLLFEQSQKYLKYIRYIKGNSKQANVVKAALIGAACLGSFSGILQGSKCAKEKIQEKRVLELYSKLKNRETWLLALDEEPLLSLLIKKRINGTEVVIVAPSEEGSRAYLQGLQKEHILISFNRWKYGMPYDSLQTEFEISENRPRYLVSVDSSSMKINTIEFSSGGKLGIKYYTTYINKSLGAEIDKLLKDLGTGATDMQEKQMEQR